MSLRNSFLQMCTYLSIEDVGYVALEKKKADYSILVLVTNTNIYKVKWDNSGSVQYLK